MTVWLLMSQGKREDEIAGAYTTRELADEAKRRLDADPYSWDGGYSYGFRVYPLTVLDQLPEFDYAAAATKYAIDEGIL